MDIKGKSYKFITSGAKRLSFLTELVKVKDLAEISQQSICCSYKTYCRGIIKGGSVIDRFFFSDVPCKPYEENSQLLLEYPSFESFYLPCLYHL